MNLLILGDVMGASGRKALSNKLPDLIKNIKLILLLLMGKIPQMMVRASLKILQRSFLNLAWM